MSTKTVSDRMAKVHKAVHSTPQMKALHDKIRRLLVSNELEGDFDVTISLRNVRPKAEPIAARPLLTTRPDQA